MNPHEEQLLIGYLLGALDPDQHRQVAERICHDPHWQRQARRWQQVLHQLEPVRAVPEPPPNLVQRTMQAVAGAARPASLPAGEKVLARAKRWSVLDVVAAAVVLAVAVLLALPAVGYLRFRSQVLHCSDNLRYLGQALSRYHHAHNHFPETPADGSLGLASAFVPLLYENRLLDHPARLFCCATPQRVKNLRLLTVDQLRRLPEQRCRELLSRMGGDYGYCIGYLRADGTYVPFRCRNDGHLALMADAPDAQLTGRPGSNHGPWGFNVLYVSGAVRFVNSPDPTGQDHLFLNRRGEVCAGCDAHDVVILPGPARVLLARD